MKLTITLQFGNDAMQTYSEARAAIAHALRTGALKPRDGDGGKLMDLNGNSVGAWEVSE